METIVIDIEARYRDQTREGVRGTTDDVARLKRKLAETEQEGRKADSALAKIGQTAKTIAKSAVTIPVKILDYATKPLRALYNYATSIRGVLTGIVMGQVGQNLFVKPTQYAETLKGHALAFENLLGSAEKADQMIRDIQEFDEKSPFNTMQIIEQSRMLMTYKLANEKNVLSMIETIGDASMGVGAGDAGIERIVRALGQMKAKGKVSAEEMLQLSEVNISGWQYLAEAYGKSTAEIQAMTQKNLIPVEDAISALLEGMRRDFGGMANTNAAKTLSGLWGQISSILENGPKLRWGQGLGEGAMKAATHLSGLLEDSKGSITAMGDALYELGKTLSTKAADGVIGFSDRLMKVLSSQAFQNAPGTVEKLKISWDQVIAQPFHQWWKADGKEFLGDVAEKVGGGLGEFYSGLIQAVMGIAGGSADISSAGGQIGAKFARGFLEGFDPKSVLETIVSGFKNAIKSAGKLLPGGQAADAGSILSAVMLGLGASKLAATFGPLAGLGRGAVGSFGGFGAQAAGSASAMALGKLFTHGGTGMAGGLLGKAGLVGAAGPMAAGTVSAAGMAGGAGALAGGAGLLSAMADFHRAVNTVNRKEQSEKGWSGAAKAGMVGAGALIGTLVLPGLGTAIGAGIGGLGALLGGGKLGKSISDALDGTGNLRQLNAEVQEATEKFTALQKKADGVDALLNRYDDLSSKIRDSKLSTEELTAAEAERKSILEQLAALYPNLITQQDAENGTLEKKLGLIRAATEAERERARMEADLTLAKGEASLPDLENAIGKSKAALADYQAELDNVKGALSELTAIQMERNTAKNRYQAGSIDQKEYNAIMADLRSRAVAAEKTYGFDDRRINSGSISGLDSVIQDLQSKRAQFDQAMLTEQDRINANMETVQSLYAAAITMLTTNPDFDLSGTLEKISQIEQYTKTIQDLQAKQKDTKAGSQEYKDLQGEIDTAKRKQAGLKTEVEQYKVQLQRVLDALTDINAQYDILGGKRLSPGDLGFVPGIDYGPYTGTKSTASGSTETTKTAKEKKPPVLKGESSLFPTMYGWASGTPSAPAGWAWVGEHGPELMKLNGGERIYNADKSRQLSEQLEHGRRSTEGNGTNMPISINLGGMTLNVTADGSSEDDIVAAIQSRLPEISNEICRMIAVQVSKIYANMPTKVEGIA